MLQRFCKGGVGSLAAGAISSLVWVHPSLAGLGRGMDGVRADQAHFAAAMSSASGASYTVQTLTLTNGGVMREYLNGQGLVFAVAWRGPGRPDLQQLLGEHFSAVATPAAQARRGARLLAVQQPDLVVHSSGRPGAFHGVAYLPQQLPAGFSGQDLR